MNKEKFTIPGTKITFEVDEILVLPLMVILSIVFSLLLSYFGLIPYVLTGIVCFVLFRIFSSVKAGGDNE